MTLYSALEVTLHDLRHFYGTLQIDYFTLHYNWSINILPQFQFCKLLSAFYNPQIRKILRPDDV